MTCFMCGLGANVVKLTQVEISATKEMRHGASRPSSQTVCEHCKSLLLKGNHPENQNLSESPEQQGYVKPSKDDDGSGEYPSVRPQ